MSHSIVTINRKNERDSVVEWLGLNNPNKRLPSSYAYISIIKGRIPTKSVNIFMRKVSIPRRMVSRVIHVSERTLQRNQPDTKLNVDSSEKLLELARLYYKGIGLFGEKEKFNSWLKRECTALGNQKPTELLDTNLGIELVADELLRIEHDVIS